MSQTEQILNHLKKGKKLNPLQALNLYGCFRLASRISELRKDGHLIDTIPTKKGKKVFASYKLNA
jgi:hypothetical protein